jgi:hypothetical protein
MSPSRAPWSCAAGGFNAAGWLLNKTIDRVTSARKARTNHYTAEQEFFVPVDATWLRLAVRDVATRRARQPGDRVSFWLPSRMRQSTNPVTEVLPIVVFLVP